MATTKRRRPASCGASVREAGRSGLLLAQGFVDEQQDDRADDGNDEAEHAASVVTPFLLPDTPVVAWWPDAAPAAPAEDPLGRLALRRLSTTSHSTWIVSPAKHGFSTFSSMLRNA